MANSSHWGRFLDQYSKRLVKSLVSRMLLQSYFEMKGWTHLQTPCTYSLSCKLWKMQHKPKILKTSLLQKKVPFYLEGKLSTLFRTLSSCTALQIVVEIDSTVVFDQFHPAGARNCQESLPTSQGLHLAAFKQCTVCTTAHEKS